MMMVIYRRRADDSYTSVFVHFDRPVKNTKFFRVLDNDDEHINYHYQKLTLLNSLTDFLSIAISRLCASDRF